ncbi:MAG: type II toxin-antitoxin system PemK/MazF family toxin [Patescibacteria group bacterium]
MSHQYEIVTLYFPFADDYTQSKLRPGLILTKTIKPHDLVIIAMISSQTQLETENHLLLKKNSSNFPSTGLKKNSIIKLDQLITVDLDSISHLLGKLPNKNILQVKSKLKQIFSV